MSRNSAARAAASRARATEIDSLIFCFHTPGANLFFAFGKGKSEAVLKDIAVIHPKCFLDVDRALALNAKRTILSFGEAALDWFFQPAVYPCKEASLSLFAHRLIVFLEKCEGRVETEERECLKAFGPQVRCENAVVSQAMTINLARQFDG